MTKETQTHKTKALPRELKNLVRKTIDILGQNIRSVYGTKRFDQVEKIRKEMKACRDFDQEQTLSTLRRSLRRLEKVNTNDLYEICHCYALYLELINRCEKAYRYSRLSDSDLAPIKSSPYAIIYVFTAHPTEARSAETLELFNQIELALIKEIESPNKKNTHEILDHLINLTLRASMSKNTGPTVEDEAWHIFSVVLAPSILDKQIELKKKNITVNFRTWVGGDKDGHPYVDEKTLFSSLKMSRRQLWGYAYKKLKQSQSNLALITSKKEQANKNSPIVQIKSVLKKLSTLEVLDIGDGKKVQSFRVEFHQLAQSYEKFFKTRCPDIEAVKNLIWLYPALVLPLEVREDSKLVEQTINTGPSKKLAIEKMLYQLKDISKGFNPKWYVRGLVLSMAQESKDLFNGIKLINKVFKAHSIPVVPLFETRHALENSVKILTETFEKEKWLKDYHENHWESRFEVMLGYSDSSKESGVLSSRYLIADALKRLDSFFKKQKLTPVFFHGSGGSIERGGGSIQEQTSWWPKSALNIFKVTVQGEMVSRSFGNSLIMQSQIEKILNELVPRKKYKESKEVREALDKMSSLSAKSYSELINSKDFIEVVQKATPYLYLDQLKIGSRPSKRQTGGEEIKLRAIPWVLCWTQTRTLLPTWYGIGSAWEKMSLEERYILVTKLKESPLLMSFTKILGFTLAKIELSVFALYLSQNLKTKKAENFLNFLEQELVKTKTFLHELTREDELLWFRPWLQESIHMRSSMIHPLNLIQLIALERKDAKLLQESVTGIACGMMTTG